MDRIHHHIIVEAGDLLDLENHPAKSQLVDVLILRW
jgi:hypothetical protein